MPADRHERASLSAFLDDELPGPAALRVTRHLARCRACAAELEGLRTARAAVRALPAVPPPRSVLAGVAAAAERRRRRRRRRLAATGAVLAAAAAVALGGFVMGADRGTVVPPVELFLADHIARTGGGPVLVPVDLQGSE